MQKLNSPANRKRSRSVYILPLATLFILSCIYGGIRIFFDLNDYKDRIEYALSAKTHSEVKINGDLDYSLFPPYFTVEKIQMTKRDSSSFYGEKLVIYPSIPSLILLELRFKEIEADNFDFRLVKTSSGLFRFADSSESILQLPAIPEKTPILNLKLSRGNFSFINTFSRDTITLNNINGEIEGITLSDTEDRDFLGRLSFMSNLIIQSSSYNWLKIDKREFNFDCRNGELNIAVIDNEKDESDELFTIQLDFTQPKYFYKINYALNQHQYNNWFDNIELKGVGSTSITLAAIDTADINLDNNLSGKFINKASNIELTNINLDSLIARQLNSRIHNELTLWDLFLFGNYGKHILQKSQLVSEKGRESNSTEIESLKVLWILENGILTPQNSVITTNNYKLLIDGEIDLTNKLYNNLSITIKDTADSKILSQKLSGSFEEYSITNE